MKTNLAHLYDWKASAQHENGRTVFAACGHKAEPGKPFAKTSSTKYKAAKRCEECERLAARPRKEWKGGYAV